MVVFDLQKSCYLGWERDISDLDKQRNRRCCYSTYFYQKDPFLWRIGTCQAKKDNHQWKSAKGGEILRHECANNKSCLLEGAENTGLIPCWLCIRCQNHITHYSMQLQDWRKYRWKLTPDVISRRNFLTSKTPFALVVAYRQHWWLFLRTYVNSGSKIVNVW